MFTVTPSQTEQFRNDGFLIVEDLIVDDGKEARLFAGVPARGVVFGRRLCAAAVGTVTSAGFCSEVGR